MAFCLVPQLAEKLKNSIIDGTVNPNKLSEMTSSERRAFFTELLGESNAKPVNALFESKMILKNQQTGMINWAKKLTGISKETKRDIISQIQRLDKVIDPSEADAFLQDLASKRLGVDISFDEARTISQLSKRITETEDKIGKADRLDYGKSVVELNDYINELKGNANKLNLSDFKQNAGKASVQFISRTAGLAKSVTATGDNSAIFRQGWKTLWTNPVIWQKNAIKSFEDLVRTFGGKEVIKEVQADIVSRAVYPIMKKAKLAVGIAEEAYPTSLPAKIPLLGKAHKASEAAYTAFLQRTRADVFEKYIQIAQKTGVPLTDDELISIGKLVNSLTGRANLGRIEPVADIVNNVFFSPRLLKSHFDVLGGQVVTGAGGSNFVRKQAALNLLKIISGTATVLVTANALMPDSIEKDPRSANFGKIKIGNTRFDVTGGMGGIATLAARYITSSSKSSITGNVSKLNARDKNDKPVFGGRTRTEVVSDFFTNKLSPAARVLYEIGKGQTFSGERPTLKNQASNLFIPLPYKTFQELNNDPDSANIIISMIAESLGISTNTYGK